jgi:hypothetical protein
MSETYPDQGRLRLLAHDLGRPLPNCRNSFENRLTGAAGGNGEPPDRAGGMGMEKCPWRPLRSSHDTDLCRSRDVLPADLPRRPGDRRGPPPRPRRCGRVVDHRGLLLHRRPVTRVRRPHLDRATHGRRRHPAGGRPDRGRHRDGVGHSGRARAGPVPARYRSRGAGVDGADGCPAQVPADRTGGGHHRRHQTARR